MSKKSPKMPGPGQRRCGACDGKGVIQCRRCWGALKQTDWRGRVSDCPSCGGTGTQACIVCGQMGVLPRR